MTLKEKIANIIERETKYDEYDILNENEVADKVLAAVKEHLTSDKAVQRAIETRYRQMWEERRVSFGDSMNASRSAILAALEEQ